MCEVEAIVGEEGVAVGKVSFADLLQRGVPIMLESLSIDKLFGDLVEVRTCSLNSCPPGAPLPQILAVYLRADNVIKVLEDEEKLGQLVESLIVAAKGRAVPVLSEESVAEPVNRTDA